MKRNLIQGISALVMLALTVATWGSAGSALTLLGLILLVCAVLKQRIGEKYDEIYDEEE